MKRNHNGRLHHEFYFWKTYDKQEIDLIECSDDSSIEAFDFLMAYTFFDVFRLNPQMDVHHIDRNKTNNALNNILPVMRDEHEAIHGRKIF